MIESECHIYLHRGQCQHDIHMYSLLHYFSNSGNQLGRHTEENLYPQLMLLILHSCMVRLTRIEKAAQNYLEKLH